LDSEQDEAFGDEAVFFSCDGVVVLLDGGVVEGADASGGEPEARSYRAAAGSSVERQFLSRRYEHGSGDADQDDDAAGWKLPCGGECGDSDGG
jgi:hypothetical protein